MFFQFVSHKLGRLIAPYAFLALAVSNLFLRGYYLVPLVFQGMWYFLVFVGHPGFPLLGLQRFAGTNPIHEKWARRMKRVLLFPYSFALMNWAAVAALYYFARGRKHIWRHATPSMQQRKNPEIA